jgi:dual specificity protein kinase YAK1
MDTVPPALARLQRMNQDVIAGRNALTPVLNRDDAMREWERRQSGKPTAAQPYPQLEYLQQQAELAAATGLTTWAGGSSGQRYAPPSKLAHSYHTVVDEEQQRRDAVMSNVRSAARGDGGNSLYGSAVIPTPPQAYNSTGTVAGNRYATTYAQQQQQQQATQGGAAGLDSIDRRTDIGAMYVPMQPDPYSGYASGPAASSSSRHVAPPSQAVAPSFYGASVVTTGAPVGSGGGAGAVVVGQRNPFSVSDVQHMAINAAGVKADNRRSGMDAWPQR